ncbi:MAG: hypothetical protein Q9178_002056 [Gyalolechia marmorata]
MTAQPSEADIIFNRANVALAKSQRLVASWLPPRTDDELKTAKTEEQIEKEEHEMFTPVPEVLGLGAKPEDVKDWDLKKQRMSSNDLLRRQLLGNNHAKSRLKGGHEWMDRRDGGPPLPVGSKPRPTPVNRALENDSSDDGGGRASLGRKKRKKPAGPIEPQKDEQIEADAMNNEEPRNERQDPMEYSKRANNYLDEVLSQRRQKKQKTKKEKKENNEGK